MAEECKGQFECLEENIEKFITFSVPIKKELENGKIVTYKIKFIDSLRFMMILFEDVTIVNAKAANLVLHT